MKYSTILFCTLVWSASNGFVQNYLISRKSSLRSQPHSNMESTTLCQYHPFYRRFDTIKSSGLPTILTSGGGISQLVHRVKTLPEQFKNLTWKDVKPIQRIKNLHGPITYLILSLLFAQKYTWAWKNPAWWFGVAFCIKWYRARYVFKIPVRCIIVGKTETGVMEGKPPSQTHHISLSYLLSLSFSQTHTHTHTHAHTLSLSVSL
jgi:hypothetical protein